MLCNLEYRSKVQILDEESCISYSLKQKCRMDEWMDG